MATIIGGISGASLGSLAGPLNLCFSIPILAGGGTGGLIGIIVDSCGGFLGLNACTRFAPAVLDTFEEVMDAIPTF